MSIQTTVHAEIQRPGETWEAACKHAGRLEEWSSKHLILWLGGNHGKELGKPPRLRWGLPQDVSDEIRISTETEDSWDWMPFDEVVEWVEAHDDGNNFMATWWRERIVQPILELDLPPGTDIRLILASS